MPSKPLICQSCGRPLERPSDHGTNADHTPNAEYCAVCYRGGAFTQPAFTIEQMIEKTANVLAIQLGIAQPKARDMVATYMPKLKRWQKQA
jgi:hypothetical protein